MARTELDRAVRASLLDRLTDLEPREASDRNITREESATSRFPKESTATPCGSTSSPPEAKIDCRPAALIRTIRPGPTPPESLT